MFSPTTGQYMSRLNCYLKLLKPVIEGLMFTGYVIDDRHGILVYHLSIVAIGHGLLKKF